MISLLFRKTRAILRLSRPANVVIAFLSIWIAALIAGKVEPAERIMLAAFSAALIMIGANVINDYFDVDIDRINKPHRPLARGDISRRAALAYFAVVYLLGWLCALLIGVRLFVVAVFVSIVLFFYSAHFKRTVIWGNLIVSWATAMAFIFAGMTVGNVRETLFPASFAFLYHFGREVIKDIQDIRGDAQSGARTFAVKYGASYGFNLTLVTFALLIILTIIPYILGVYHLWYFVIVLSGVYPILIGALIVLRTDPTPQKLGIISGILKAGMVIGLVAIYFR